MQKGKTYEKHTEQKLERDEQQLCDGRKTGTLS